MVYSEPWRTPRGYLNNFAGEILAEVGRSAVGRWRALVLHFFGSVQMSAVAAVVAALFLVVVTFFFYSGLGSTLIQL